MTDDNRLAQIEARRMDILAEWDNQLPRYDVTIIVDDDIPWLIARIHELKAQAAANAAIAGAAEQYLNAMALFDAAFANDAPVELYWRRAELEWDLREKYNTLVSELAARKGGGLE